MATRRVIRNVRVISARIIVPRRLGNTVHSVISMVALQIPITHNTANCKIHNSDGTRKRGKSKSNGDKKTHNNFAQLLKDAQEAKEEIKGLKKDNKHLKKKRPIEESDSDTDA
jgi:hypothetical protein